MAQWPTPPRNVTPLVRHPLHARIGDTPLVELQRIPRGTGIRVFAKPESANPGGSVKDRAARGIVQHALLTLFDLVAAGKISIELLVDRACHASADIFGVQERGYVREGWFADLVLVDTARPFRVSADNVLYKCGWSPFEGHEFSSSIDTTIVNGDIVYRDGQLTGNIAGRRLDFGRAR